MITAEQFYASFDKADFLKTALWTPAGGGAAQSKQVRFRSPTEEALSGQALVTDYSIEYPASAFTPGVKRGDKITVEGVDYAAREDPRKRFDGSVLRVLLKKGYP
jgi:hypothetical protein